MYEIDCAHCQSKWMVKAETIVNATIEYSLKQSILDESFFKRKCKNCGNTIYFYYSFLYCDTKNKVLVALKIKEDSKWIEQLKMNSHYKDFELYEIEDGVQLKELILVSDYNLDYNRILECKKKLQHQYTNMYVDAVDECYVWMVCNETFFGIEIRHVNKNYTNV